MGSAKEYISSVWCLLAHTKKVDVVLNNTVRMITKHVGKIQVFSEITPLDLRWEVAAMVDRKKQKNDHNTPCLEKFKFIVN